MDATPLQAHSARSTVHSGSAATIYSNQTTTHTPGLEDLFEKPN